MKTAFAFICVVGLTSCTQSASTPTMEIEETRDLTGLVSVVGSTVSGSNREVDVVVAISNTSGTPLRFVVLANCPVVVKLLQHDVGGVAVYDESNTTCNRAGRLIDIGVAKTVSLTRTIKSDDLRSLSAGVYRVVVNIGSAAAKFDIDAGVVQLQ